MVTSQAQHSTNDLGVLRSNSACSMLMSDDLRLPRRGIESRVPRQDIGSTAMPLPLPCVSYRLTPSRRYRVRSSYIYIYLELSQSVKSNSLYSAIDSKLKLKNHIRYRLHCLQGQSTQISHTPMFLFTAGIHQI